MRPSPGVGAVAVAVAIACAPIDRPASPDAPVNSCPDNPCSAFKLEEDGSDAGSIPTGDAAAPLCAGNACLVSAPPSSAQHLILVVAVPANTPQGQVTEGTDQGATYAMYYESLPFVSSPQTASTATQQPIVTLPQQVPVSGVYWVDPSVSNNPFLAPFGELGFFVGLGIDVALPAHVIYRPLWPPIGTNAAGDASLPPTEATELGLPLEPILAGQTQVPEYRVPEADGGVVVGPVGGKVLEFVTALLPGMAYERTIAPDPPFDVAFPPDVRRDPDYAGQQQQAQRLVPDTTVGGMFPHFFLKSARGVEGWSMYLRDATTKRPLSPVRLLSNSTVDAGILLPTSHNQPNDALTGAELVIVPAPDSGLPTFVPFPTVLQSSSTTQEYPLLPQPLQANGQIDWPDVQGPDAQAPLAQVTFQAVGIYAPLPPPVPSDAGALADATKTGAVDAGTTYVLQQSGFEYSTTTTAQPDAGTSTYSIQIPCGTYRVVIRPEEPNRTSSVDGSLEAQPAVTVVYYDTEPTCTAPPPPLTAGLASIIRGTATVADGRALSAATVEALPMHCPNIADAGVVSKDSPTCMPRYGWTTTDAAGAFALPLDPGEYVLRVEPLDGTRLPWVMQPLVVPAPDALHVTIPAPVYRGLQIRDPSHFPIANAIVRMFTLQGKGPAIEVGRAITDDQGRFDMYIDPAVQ